MTLPVSVVTQCCDNTAALAPVPKSRVNGVAPYSSTVQLISHLYMDDGTHFGYGGCTGTLSQRADVILTAAHCIRVCTQQPALTSMVLSQPLRKPSADLNIVDVQEPSAGQLSTLDAMTCGRSKQPMLPVHRAWFCGTAWGSGVTWELIYIHIGCRPHSLLSQIATHLHLVRWAGESHMSTRLRAV